MCHPLRRKRQGPNGSRMLGQAHNTTAMFLSQFGNVSVWCSGRHWTWPMVQGHAGGGGGVGVNTPYPRCPQPSFHHPVPSPSTSLRNLDCQWHSLFGIDATVVIGRVPPNLSFTFWFTTGVPRFFFPCGCLDLCPHVVVLLHGKVKVVRPPFTEPCFPCTPAQLFVTVASVARRSSCRQSYRGRI